LCLKCGWRSALKIGVEALVVIGRDHRREEPGEFDHQSSHVTIMRSTELLRDECGGKIA
jgi:hypothetical protein